MNHLINNKYEIIESVGSGGFGSVYKVLDVKIHKEYALKLIPHKTSIENLQNEIRHLNECKDWRIPYIVDAIEYEQADIQYYGIIMEYIEGKNLKLYLEESSNMTEDEAVSIVLEIADIIKTMHEMHPSLIYGDVNPNNFILDHNHQVHLVDLGSALEENEITEKTNGTYGYSAPEVIKGELPTKKSDIYGIGAILFYLLSGLDLSLPPFHIPDMKSNEFHISKSLQKIIECCCALDSQKRYESMDHLISDLNHLNGRRENLKNNFLTAGYYLALFTTTAYTGYAATTMNRLSVHRNEKLLIIASCLTITLLLRIIRRINAENHSLIKKREWNVIYTEKKTIGLCLLVLCLFSLTGCMQKEPGHVQVTLQDKDGNNVLIKDGTVYEAIGKLNFSLPIDEDADYQIYFYENNDNEIKESYYQIK